MSTTTGPVPMPECDPSPPSRTVMTAATATVATLVVLTLVGEAASGQLRPVLDIGLGLAGVVLVATLPSRPTVIAVVLALLAPLSPALVPTACGATLYVARTRPTSVAVALTVLATVTHTLRGVWRPTGDLPLGWWVVIVIAVQAALLGWGALGRSHERVVAILLERARRAEADRDAREREARAQERTAIAREMHDVLAHRLSLVATWSGALEVRPDASPEQRDRAVGVVREHVHRALDELREVIGVLRADMPVDEPLRPQPGLEDLPELVEDSRAVGTGVRLDARVSDPGSAPGTTARTAYRVVQESLTNVRRHAPGADAEVTVAGGPGEGLEVRVTNPLPTSGAPLSPSDGASRGLVGLTERVSLAGGTLDHGPRTEGFVVRARLPWPE